MAPRVSDVQHNGTRLQMTLSRVDVSVVNAIRRAIMADVRTVALPFDMQMSHPATTPDENPVVEPGCRFYVNRTALHNQFLGHRLSLVPLHFDRKETRGYRTGDYLFRIKVANKTAAPMDVTTRDIEVLDASGKTAPASLRDRVFPPNTVTKDWPLLVRLKPSLSDSQHEELWVEARAALGCGRDHARFNPVSKCVFHPAVDESAASAARAGLPEAERADFDAIDRFRHFAADEAGRPLAFRFQVESECGLRPAEVVQEALEALVARVEAVVRDPPAFEDVGQPSGVLVATLQNEDHTLGQLLHCRLFQHHCGPGGRLKYAAYTVPHPLQRALVFKLAPAEGFDAPAAAECFLDAAKEVALDLRDLAADVDAHVES